MAVDFAGEQGKVLAEPGDVQSGLSAGYLRHASYPSDSIEATSSGPPSATMTPSTSRWTRSASQFVEHPLVVGDHQHAQIGPVLTNRTDPSGHRPEGVDVEPRIRLVEYRHLRFEDGHLEDLVALLLTPGEALVEVTLTEGGIHAQLLHPLHHHQTDFENRHLRAPAGGQGLAEELDHRHAR